uniref:SMARCC C-terminal domain-containing protein n=2 Tax=Physcomitrium patens TaxID=3218 RepID=A0A2K1KK08_PHYPA|nr:hypothetical protein PHYPA_007781 [Physcomitrium patens]
MRERERPVDRHRHCSLHLLANLDVNECSGASVAAANAKLLADEEEREIKHLVASIIDYQMKKLYSKLEHFAKLLAVGG